MKKHKFTPGPAEDGIVERIEGDFARDDRIGKALASHDAQLEAEVLAAAILRLGSSTCHESELPGLRWVLTHLDAMLVAALSPAKPKCRGCCTATYDNGPGRGASRCSLPAGHEQHLHRSHDGGTWSPIATGFA